MVGLACLIRVCLCMCCMHACAFGRLCYFFFYNLSTFVVNKRHNRSTGSCDLFQLAVGLQQQQRRIGHSEIACVQLAPICSMCVHL